MIHLNGFQIRVAAFIHMRIIWRIFLSTAVVFGQGSQNKDMADSFGDVSSFNDVIDQGSEILNYDVREAIKNEHKINDTRFIHNR